MDSDTVIVAAGCLIAQPDNCDFVPGLSHRAGDPPIVGAYPPVGARRVFVANVGNPHMSWCGADR